jgi:glycosyltransferase involved in cell wall biosynthesis
MRVLLLYCGTHSGLTRTIISLGAHLKRHDIETCYVFGQDCAFIDEFDPLVTCLVNQNLKAGRGKIEWLRNRFLPAPGDLASVVKSRKIELLFSYVPETIPLALRLGRTCSLPVVGFLRKPEKERRLKRLCAHHLRYALFDSQFVMDANMDFLLKHDRLKKGAVFHNSLDVEEFVASASGAWVQRNSEEILVGMVGRMIPWKGPDFLLKVARRVLTRHANVKFWLAGRFEDKNYERETKELAVQLGIAEHVRFIDHQKNISPYMAEFDILAHPSANFPEPFGLVLIEAMAHKKPVVSARVGGIPEVVEHGKTGFLCEQKNEDEFSGALLKLIENKELRREMGENGYRRVNESFHTAVAAEKLASILHEVVLAETAINAEARKNPGPAGTARKA